MYLDHLVRGLIAAGMVLISSISLSMAIDADDGFVSMFDGQTMDGWKMVPRHEGHWQALDGVIDYDGRSEAKNREDQNLCSDRWYRDFTFRFDWRFSSRPKMSEHRILNPQDGWVRTVDGKYAMESYLSAGDSGIYLRGTSLMQINLWCHPMGSGQVHAFMIDTNLPLKLRRACVPRENTDRAVGEWNSMEVTLVGNDLTISQNGVVVIDHVILPGRLPYGGPLMLQHHGDPIQFRNLYIKEHE